MEITTMVQALQFHALILKSGNKEQNYSNNLSKLFTFSALSTSGSLTYARHILNSIKTPNSYYYNTMIRAYSDSPDPTRVFPLFLSMHCQLDEEGIPLPDKFTYPFVLKACFKSGHTRFGKQIHGLLYKVGLFRDLYVQNVLICMYAGCGELSYARKVFDEMSVRDVVSWTSLIDGCVENGKPFDGLKLFEKMMEDGVDPNDATLVSVLRACADTGALSFGDRVNEIVERKKCLKSNVGTALIDMYAKCGCIDSAVLVFDKMSERNVFVWTAMISGFASHMRCKEAVYMFYKMKSFGIRPDERTMTAVLSACRNAGWVSEGLNYITNMIKDYNITPTIQHYGSIVDLLARTGHLDDAEEFFTKIPFKPDDVLCRTLIWACKFHGDVERAERLMKNLEFAQALSNDCGSYILLSNLYASVGKWDSKAQVRESMHRKGFVKPPGSCRVEINGIVHEFIAGDSGHFESELIYRKLDEIKERLRNEGYNPKLSEALLEIDDEERETQLLHHSEKLAVSFGLIKTKPGKRIRILKNLRSCEDCHLFMKLVSKIYQREIIIRDRTIFHCFKNGECSCQDYW